MPPGDWQARLDEYFRDTPRRVAEGTNGYKADVLHGIWAQAPYLHNGSVPTLGQLMCAATRPARFLRGNLHYDEALVGFEWADRPTRAIRPERHDPDQGVRHDGPGQSQHRPHLRRGSVPGHERPGSGRRSEGDRDAAAGVTGRGAARVFEDLSKTRVWRKGVSDEQGPGHRRHRLPWLSRHQAAESARHPPAVDRVAGSQAAPLADAGRGARAPAALG